MKYAFRHPTSSDIGTAVGRAPSTMTTYSDGTIVLDMPTLTNAEEAALRDYMERLSLSETDPDSVEMAL